LAGRIIPENPQYVSRSAHPERIVLHWQFAVPIGLAVQGAGLSFSENGDIAGRQESPAAGAQVKDLEDQVLIGDAFRSSLDAQVANSQVSGQAGC